MNDKPSGEHLWTFTACELPLPSRSHEAQTTTVPSFEVHRGSITLLTGASGSGKSWLLAHLVGSADASAIHWWPLHHRRRILSGIPTLPHHLSCAVATQAPRIRGELPVGWEYEFVQQSLGLPLDSALLDRVDLPSEIQVGRLSGGQAKRFGIALRLSVVADIVALDEPEAGLDSASAARVIKALMTLPGSPAIIAVTHHPEAWHQALSGAERQMQVIEITGSSRSPDVRTKSSFELIAAPLDRTMAGVLRWPVIARVTHSITLWMRSPLDWAVVFLAPLVIGLVIGLQATGGANRADAAWTDKQSFFAVIAACWLGLQFMSRETHGQLQVLREEWRWLDRICPLRLEGLLAGCLTIVSGVIAASLIAIIQSFLLAVAVYASASTIQGTPLSPDRWPLLWLGLGVASLWGVILGQALAAVVAAIQMANPFRRSLPSLLWVNLLIPLVMLAHIVFSSAYLRGIAYDPSLQCAGWKDSLIAAFPTNWCTLPVSGGNLSIDGLWFVVAGSWAMIVISVVAMWLIIRSPDIRRQ